MGFHGDASSDHTKWSTRKLIAEIKRLANFETFSVGWNDIPAEYKVGWHEQVNPDAPRIEDFIRAQTRIYRDTWLNPLIEELERRFTK
jgi:hypothetical protein